MATYAYIRVSTKRQTLERQSKELSHYKIDKLFSDKHSGKSIKELPELNKLLELLKPNDTVIITNINRIGRDVVGIVNLLKTLEDKDIKLIISESPFKKIDLKDPQTMLSIYMQVIIADYERKVMLIVQKKGIEVAKGRGKYKRIPKQKKKKQDDIMELVNKGGLTYNQIAKICDCSKQHVINVIKYVEQVKEDIKKQEELKEILL